MDRPSDCADIDVINTLDGFNLQPRLSIPFDGPIDVSTVSSQTVFLLSLGSTLPGGPFPFHVVGINQVVWDPATFTLHVESDELLDQHTRYALIVTGGVHDLDGDPVTATEAILAPAAREGPWPRRTTAVKDYAQGRSRGAATPSRRASPGLPSIAASASSPPRAPRPRWRRCGPRSRPARRRPADFALGSDGSRTVFPLSTISGVAFTRQIGTNQFVTVPVPAAAPGRHPGRGGHGGLRDATRRPTTRRPAASSRPSARAPAQPVVQGTNDVFFTLFLPAGAQPANGWPVAIFGHGFGDNKNNSPYAGGRVAGCPGDRHRRHQRRRARRGSRGYADRRARRRRDR